MQKGFLFKRCYSKVKVLNETFIILQNNFVYYS